MRLTDEAYRLALIDAAGESIVASIALIEHAGLQSTWPEAFRTTAVSVYNERAEAESLSPARESSEGRSGSLEEEGITLGSE